MRRELDPLAADDAARAGALLLDVREPEEFAAGHAPGAIELPLGQLEARLAEVPRSATIVCVCRSGGRSGTAADALEGAGYDARNLAGGMIAWAAEGLPVQDAAGGSGTVI